MLKSREKWPRPFALLANEIDCADDTQSKEMCWAKHETIEFHCSAPPPLFIFRKLSVVGIGKFVLHFPRLYLYKYTYSIKIYTSRYFPLTTLPLWAPHLPHSAALKWKRCCSSAQFNFLPFRSIKPDVAVSRSHPSPPLPSRLFFDSVIRLTLPRLLAPHCITLLFRPSNFCQRFYSLRFTFDELVCYLSAFDQLASISGRLPLSSAISKQVFFFL